MLSYPHIDPVLVSFGPLQVRWYGLMYLLGFLASYLLVRKQILETGFTRLGEHFENINIALILAVVLGGRLGYVVFYNPRYYLAHPLEVLATWHGGMSFHGALVAVIATGLVYCRRKKIDFWRAADIYAATIPIGLGLGRLGNFINAELFGRAAAVPWAMVFPGGGDVGRHPSQLYEFFFEGVVLFCLLWSVRKKASPAGGWFYGAVTALFLTGYGVARFFVEFFREPDVQIGFLFGGFTMGQLLSSGMIAAGGLIWCVRRRQGKKEGEKHV